MYDLKVAWRNLRNRPIESSVPIFVVALAIALSVTVFALSDGAEEGIVQASDPFQMLVIGSAGSGQDLVLSSVMLQGNPIGNIPYEVYENLENDIERVQLAVPLAMGDSVGNARIIGTNHNFFEIRRTQVDPPAFQLAEGRLFTEAIGNTGDILEAEAVFGALSARRLGLNIGDTFLGTHGIGVGIAENVHENVVYTVVGILHPTNTPYDTAVYTSLDAVWGSHVRENDPNNAFPTIAGLTPQVVADAPSSGEVTAVLVSATSFANLNRIAQEFYLEPTLQAAFPGDELGQLIGLLNQGQQVLEIVGYLVLGIAGLTLFLSMYSAVLSRQQSIAIMRGLGNNRASIFRMIIFETLIVSIVGALLGRVIGYSLALIIADIYSAQSAIPIPIRFLPELELVLWVLSIGVGILAGLIPAWLAYRVDVVKHLFPS
ncbi:MAG: FtsX-like permease family protein [Chloroflexota bacterium]